MIPKLKEVNDMIQIELQSLTHDWQVMSKLVRWCDSYSRWGRLHFDISKDFINYTVLLECHPELHAYIKKIIVYCRFNDTSKFKEFVMQKFRKSLPKIEKYELPKTPSPSDSKTNTG